MDSLIHDLMEQIGELDEKNMTIHDKVFLLNISKRIDEFKSKIAKRN